MGRVHVRKGENVPFLKPAMPQSVTLSEEGKVIFTQWVCMIQGCGSLRPTQNNVYLQIFRFSQLGTR